MDHQDLVAAARFGTSTEARVACDYLTAHGVEAMVMEQDRLRFDPLKPGQPPGVRVMVRQADANAARELLEAVATSNTCEAEGER